MYAACKAGPSPPKLLFHVTYTPAVLPVCCCAAALQVIRLIEAVEGLKAQLDVPPTIRQVMNKAGSSEGDAAYLGTTLEMAYQAFDDQCTGANPRYPVSVLSC
jgi:hypothetical protein